MLILQEVMLFYKYHLKMVKNYLEKYLLLILLVIKEELIIWIWVNKPELMEQKSINLYFHLNNALEHLIKEKDILLLEDQN